ncbi:O-antigen ligase family protein, partial [Acidobacteriota bacterium]
MKYSPIQRLLFLLSALAGGIGLYFFYIKYVPLVWPFQWILLPLCLILLILTVIHFQSGALVFVFCFPLINFLPYLFKIYENIPQAPTAIVLFLFFFLGFLFRAALRGFRLDISHKIFKPIQLLSILIALSGIITFFRYTNFFPFWTDGIFELTTNTFGVSAGGALMSVVLFALNYLSSFVFLFFLINLMTTKGFISRLADVLSGAALLSFSFGVIQLLFNRRLGNGMISINEGLINATFKDSLSLGVFIAMTSPLLLALALSRKGGRRVIVAAAFILSLVLSFFTGSKSGLFGLFLSLGVFLWLKYRFASETRNRALRPRRSPLLKISAVAAICLLLFAGYVILNSSSSQTTTISRIERMFSQGAFSHMAEWRGRLWDGAMEMISTYPLSGVGMGAYIIELPNFHGEFRGREVPQSAENYFLHMGAELGIPGVLLIIWIFFLLGAALFRGVKNISLLSTDRLLLFAAAGGVIAFLVNTIFHTYIGSYEVKYTFWLLAALILSFDIKRRSGTKDPRTLRSILFPLLAVLIVFGLTGIHLWNSLHSLSLESRTQDLGLIHHFGFHQEEMSEWGKPFRWTKQHAGQTVDLNRKVLIIPIRASHPDIMENPVHVKIYIVEDKFRKKELLDEFTLQNAKWTWKKYVLPEKLNKRILLLYEVSRTWNPKKDIGVPDSRDLGISVAELWIRGE